MAKGVPKHKGNPADREVRIANDPQNYLKQTPVWRFADFDWDGPFGLVACQERRDNLVNHFRQHLACFETMTWEEILKATGGKRNGNNSHPIETDKFTRTTRDRLKEKGIRADSLFSLRLDATTRIYGVRENNVLRLVFFDPFHDDHNRSAYDFGRK